MERLFSFKAYVICVVILTSWTSGVTSELNGTHSTFSAVFTKCARETNLPTVPNDSDILKVLLTVTQSKSVYNIFLSCMGNHTMYSFRNSNDTTEWYMARVFDRARADQFWSYYEMFNGQSKDLTCLTSNGQMDTIEQCISNFTDKVDVLRRSGILMLDNLSNSAFKQTVCGKIKYAGTPTPTECLMSLVNNSCSMQLKQFVSTFVMMVSCTSYGPSTPASIPPYTGPYTSPVWSTNQPSPQPDYPQDAFFSCLNILYPGEYFTMLFPPSEASLYLINNITAASRQHEMDIEKFCSKIEIYAQCVKLKISSPRNRMDFMLKKYVDVVNFEKTFKEYCASKDVVSAQFQCTYRSTKADMSCRGGMNDVINSITSTIGQNSWLLCRNFKTSRECRVNRQLKPCGQQYANVMEKLLAGVLNEKCRAGELIYPENSQTDLMPCFGEYLAGISERVAAAFGNQNLKPNIYDIVKYVLNEVEVMCSHRDTMFACMRRTLKDSTKTMDMILKRMFSIENMIKIFDFNCDIMPDLKNHAPCLIDNFRRTMNTSQDFNQCVAKEMQNITKGMANMTFDPKVQNDAFCTGLSSMMHCYTPIMSGCDANLLNKFNELMMGMQNSCNNLGYKLEFNANSGSGFQTIAPITLLTSLVLRYLV